MDLAFPQLSQHLRELPQRACLDKWVYLSPSNHPQHLSKVVYLPSIREYEAQTLACANRHIYRVFLVQSANTEYLTSAPYCGEKTVVSVEQHMKRLFSNKNMKKEEYCQCIPIC